MGENGVLDVRFICVVCDEVYHSFVYVVHAALFWEMSISWSIIMCGMRGFCVGCDGEKKLW